MSKRPAFQFYPADWRKEQGLRLCSPGARSLWIDMLCLMHEGEPYGHLTDVDSGMTPTALARLVGESAANVKRWLAELQTRNVYSVTADGMIYSRRMVRDEAVREARASGGQAGAEHGKKGAAHGAKGGRPRKDEGGSDDHERGDKKPPLKPPPSTSSSSPSSQPFRLVSETAVESEHLVPPSKSPARATRLPIGWLPEPEHVAYAAQQGFSAQAIANMGDDFRDYWTAKAGKDATKTDWLATWRRWVREQAKRQPRLGSPSPAAKRVGFV